MHFETGSAAFLTQILGQSTDRSQSRPIQLNRYSFPGSSFLSFLPWQKSKKTVD